MSKRQPGLTIYPDAALTKKIRKEAEKQKRSMNYIVLVLLDSALASTTKEPRAAKPLPKAFNSKLRRKTA